MSIINSQPLIGASGSAGYQIQRSVRLRNSATAYFSRTNSNSPTNNKIGTLSIWVKRGAVTNGTGNNQYLIETGTGTGGTVTDGTNFSFYYTTGDSLSMGQYSWAGYSTTQVYRDPSSWYHIVISYNSTLASNNVSLYVNNVLQGTTTVVQNTNWAILNSGQEIDIGRHVSVNRSFDGYIAEINLIDGQALTPSSFGETNTITGVWQPKKYNGTYGTNGFYLNFSDNSGVTATTIGKDYSGNGNNWTPNNISVTAGATYDSMLDVPTSWADGGNGRGNYAVMNPLDTGSNITLSEANLKTSGNATNANSRGTIGMSSGKWYWEVQVISGGNYVVGIATQAGSNSSGGFTLYAGGYGYVDNGSKANNGTQTAYGGAMSANDIIGVAFDADAGTLTFYKNNVSQGQAFSGLTSGPYFPAASCQSSVMVANFGQRPFTYTPPSGFKALNTQNLPDPTIKKGNQYFDATTYTGTGTTQNIANSGGFQPDLVWTKLRSLSAGHNLVDSVRGATKALYSNLTNAETTDTLGLTAFNADGFTLGGASGYNNNGATAVGWQWKKGATQGFDIVTYTGNGANRTIAHNLGVAPKMIIVKGRSLVSNWNVFHKSVFDVNSAYTLQLNSTTFPSGGGSPTIFNSTAPTSSVFSIGTSADVNTNGSTFIAYLFAETAGFSKMGSYTGNGNADGPFVFLGFRPKLIIIKSTATANSWHITDTSRSIYNQAVETVWANEATAESTSSTQAIDILSNGFKIRNVSSEVNNSGTSMIYMAFAENPFKYSLAR